MLAGVPEQCGCRRKKLSEAARLLARGQLELDDAESVHPEDDIEKGLALLGLYLEDGLCLDNDEFWLWPENEEAFLFWLTVQTQWTVGPHGPTGLNYSGIEVCMRRRAVRASERNRLFELMQAMERATLNEWAKART